MEPENNSVPVPTSGLEPIRQGLGRSWKFYKTNFRKIFNIVVAPLVVSIICYFVGQALAPSFPGKLDLQTLSAAFCYGGLLVVISLIAGLVQYISSLALLAFIVDPTQTVGQAYRTGLKRFWSYLWITILICFISLGSVIFLVIPAIIIGVWLCLSVYVLFAEDKKGMGALLASRNYVKGYWWPVVFRLIIGSLVAYIPAGIISGILNSAIGKYGFDRYVTLLAVPFIIYYVYDLYLQLKAVKREKQEDVTYLTGTRKWFTAFAIIGPVIFVLILLGLIFGGIVLYQNKDKFMNELQNNLQQMQTKIDTSTLPVGTDTFTTPEATP